jgi:hypothetical protein
MMLSTKFKLMLTLLLMSFAQAGWSQSSASQSQTSPDNKALTATDALEGADKPEIAKKRAVRNPELYSTTVELLSQGDGARNAANARALVQVVNQLTGQTNAGSNPVVRGAMPNAGRWVKTSQQNAGSSDSEGNTLIGGTAVLKASMRISFEPNPIDSLIAASGLAYWTGDRPKPMLWLSIDDGRGPRLVTSKQLNVIKSLADRGIQRGMRYLVPQGTNQEIEASQAVFNLNAKAIEPLNARYGDNAMLIGKIYRSQSGWSAWWVLWQNGAELARWPVTKPDARQVIASGADYTADYYAKRDSVVLEAGKSGLMAMEIQSVETVQDYVRFMTFLQTHAAVKSVVVTSASANNVDLNVDLKSGVNAFRGLMRSSVVLEPLGAVAKNNIDRNVLENSTNSANDVLVIERFALKK